MQQERTGGKREIFGSHYDEGRITRELDEDYVWGLLAQRSIQNYRNIEKESGQLMQWSQQAFWISLTLKRLGGRNPPPRRFAR